MERGAAACRVRGGRGGQRTARAAGQPRLAHTPLLRWLPSIPHPPCSIPDSPHPLLRVAFEEAVGSRTIGVRQARRLALFRCIFSLVLSRQP